MSFLEQWHDALPPSFEAYAKLATETQEALDFTYGLPAASILEPVSQPVKQFDLEAMKVIQDITKGSATLPILQSWHADRMVAAHNLATQASQNDVLRTELDSLLKYFNGLSRFSEALARTIMVQQETSADVHHVAEQIKAAMVNVGGETNIANLTINFNWSDSAPGPAKTLPADQPKPRFDFEPETVLIPAGLFWMGSEPGPNIPTYETPCSQIELPAYEIGKYPVTNKQYWTFVKDRGYEFVPIIGWKGRKPLKTKYNHPVVEISWQDAQAYCCWLQERTGRPYRLPSEAEWEKAARGAVDKRVYPWGDEWQPDRCNHSDAAGHIIAVDAFPPQITHGADGHLYDLVGNVREWTQTLWGDDMEEPEFPYPWTPDAREVLATADDYSRPYYIYRGGAFDDERAQLRCSARDWYAPDVRNTTYGFRVVLPLKAGQE